MQHQRRFPELSKSCLKLQFKHVTIATYDVKFMQGSTCDLFRRHFGKMVIEIRFKFSIFEEKLKF